MFTHVYIINRSKLYEVHNHKRKVASTGTAFVFLVNIKEIHQSLKCSYERRDLKHVLPGKNPKSVRLEKKAVIYANPVCCLSTS